MGFTGLARWVNAPPTGLDLISENIMRNHQGQRVAKWNLSIRSYRSTLGQIPNFSIPSERTMCTLTMHDNVFVLLEDPLAPTSADVVATAPPEQINPHFPGPTHYRTSFLTLSPPNALEQLLTQLKARWVPVRQSSSSTAQRVLTGSQGQQLSIEGNVFAIGTDWIIRVGNVTLNAGTVKGMILEAEYLPLPVLHSPISDGTSELLSNMLTSVLPNVREAKTVAVTISEAQWEEFLWDREEEERKRQEVISVEDEDEVFVHDDANPERKRDDWTGVERDRRSAFLIMGALKSEGIL